MTRTRRRRGSRATDAKTGLQDVAHGSAIIRMRGITKVFNTTVGDFTALRGVDVDFRRGEFVSVVGKSGSGKSTLVNMITGIDRPTSGDVLIGDVAGSHPGREPDVALARPESGHRIPVLPAAANAIPYRERHAPDGLR